jgi:hypothetical protein
MNPAAILALISDLYQQVAAQRQQIADLEAALESADASSPHPRNP